MWRKLLLSLALVLAGCSAPESGTVYDKQYYPAHQWVDSQCIQYNKSGICINRMPIIHNDPEQWLLCLRNGDESGCRYVDQITWHKYERGQEYP